VRDTNAGAPHVHAFRVCVPFHALREYKTEVEAWQGLNVQCVVLDGREDEDRAILLAARRLLTPPAAPQTGGGGQEEGATSDQFCGEGNTLCVRRRDPLTDAPVFTGTENLEAARHAASECHIPPAYDNVHICKNRSKLRYVGQDAKGRWQYRYSDGWSAQQEHGKLEAIAQMDSAFWERLHGRITPHLDAGRRWNTDKLYAAATALLIRCPFRPGWRAAGSKQAGGASSDGDAPHFGLTSLQNKHIRVLPNSEQAHFDFCGKSGKTNTCDIFSDGEANTKLIRLLHTLSQSGKADEPLFRYQPKATTRHSAAECGVEPARRTRSRRTVRITADGLARFLEEHGGVHPKDFRTFHANNTVLTSLRSVSDPYRYSRDMRLRHIHSAVREAARRLNNTPAICRKSYVFGRLCSAYAEQPLVFAHIADSALSTVLKAILASATVGMSAPVPSRIMRKRPTVRIVLCTR
jgi:DNA topoisomerase-1